MAQHHISTSALIHAPAEKVYNIIADYRDGHPHILPKPYFVSMTVEQGGVGAGTQISFQMKLMGKLQTFHADISEPEPGRVLVETNSGSGAVTTFTVEPRNNGQHAQVTIATDIQVPGGMLGAIQGRLTARVLRPVYVNELAQLAAFAAK
jgi:hypothetical protein